VGVRARHANPGRKARKGLLLSSEKEAKDFYSCASVKMPAMASIVEAAEE
jgi:hypothetical protein